MRLLEDQRRREQPHLLARARHLAIPQVCCSTKSGGRELKSYRLEAFYALTQAENICGEQADDCCYCDLCLGLILCVPAYISCRWLGFSIFPS